MNHCVCVIVSPISFAEEDHTTTTFPKGSTPRHASVAMSSIQTTMGIRVNKCYKRYIILVRYVASRTTFTKFQAKLFREYTMHGSRVLSICVRYQP